MTVYTHKQSTGFESSIIIVLDTKIVPFEFAVTRLPAHMEPYPLSSHLYLKLLVCIP